jgi:hypothetical protein
MTSINETFNYFRALNSPAQVVPTNSRDKLHHWAIEMNAQVAELVDALVSNTSFFGSTGSTPVLGTSATSAQKG